MRYRRNMSRRDSSTSEHAASAASAGRVVLYSKPGCHLCEDMHTLIRRALHGTAVTVVERNIALDLDEYERYRNDVPVLHIDGREVARHRITEAALVSALRVAGIL